MSIAETLIAALAWSLPELVRRRYREEWLADVAGARELGLSPWAVVAGAVMTASTMDRTDPLVTGITKSRLAANRMRWAAAWLGSAVILGMGLFLWGGYASLLGTPIAVGLQVLVFVLTTLGLFSCLGAAILAFDFHGGRTALALGVGTVGVVVLVAAVMLAPFLALLGVPVALVAVIVAVSGLGEPAGTPRLSGRRRLGLALPFTVLTLLIVAAGVMHILVWNPLARVPGVSLTEIYAEMSAANELSFAASYGLVWAVFWGAAALMLPILGSIGRLAGFLTARRIVVLGLFLVGATGACHWLAGFSMGMSLADTFMTSGGDAAPSGPVIALIGQAALIAAILVGLPPRRNAAKLVPAGPAA